MKIADFKRNEANEIIAIGEDGAEVVLPFEYVAANKPQVGDEYVAVESVVEVAAIVEAAGGAVGSDVEEEVAPGANGASE